MAKLPQGMNKRIIKGQTYFEMRFTLDGVRYSVAAKSVQECMEKAENKKEEARAKAERKPGDITLNEYRESHLESWRRTVTTSRANNSDYLYGRAAAAPADAYDTPLGQMKVRDIERKHLEKVQGKLAEEYSAETVNLMMIEINMQLNGALVDQLIDRNPSNGIRQLRRTKKPARETIHRALTLEETEKFFKAAEACHSWYLPLYDFLLNTGMRVGEASALFPSDISRGEDGAVKVKIERTLTKGEGNKTVIGTGTKNSSSKRSIYLNAAARSALARQRRLDEDVFDGNVMDFAGNETPIFRSPYGALVHPGQLAVDLRRICEKAKIERFSVHAFRDTFATRSLESGMNPKTLQEILGHAKIDMTMNLYAHVMDETKKEQMAAVVTRKAKEA